MQCRFQTETTIFSAAEVFRQSGVRRTEFILNATAGDESLGGPSAQRDSGPRCLAACFFFIADSFQVAEDEEEASRAVGERSGRQVEESKADILLSHPDHIFVFYGPLVCVY